MRNLWTTQRLHCEGGHFVDKQGRVILLRGVNLSGSSKVPSTPDGNTALDQSISFQNHRDVSFIGKPFFEEEAEEHYNRLKKWGFNFLRFLVTWEAVEHSGIGVYDEAYLDYVVRMVAFAEKKGFYVFIDPHQDVWSRFTGGDGAPGWTLEAIGIDVKKIAQADLAILHHVKKENYPKMGWPLNYQKYPTATMFTLFFGGKVFANRITLEGLNIQDYLQNAYIQAMVQLAKKLSKFKNVLGFGSLNEPSPGWIGHPNLLKYKGFGNGFVDTSTPFQEMCMSEGVSLNVTRCWMFGSFKIPVSQVRLNSKGISIWQKDMECVWKKQGVWNYSPNGAPLLIKPEYFLKVNGKKVEFFQDFLKPFIKNFQTAIQKVQKQFFIFIESDPAKLELEWEEIPKKGYNGVVNATHWYDVKLLFLKRYIEWFGIDVFKAKLVIGKKKVNQLYIDSIGAIKTMSEEKMQNSPTVIGETGIPMDMEKRYAYKIGDYSKHEKVLDKIFISLEKHFVNVCLWNYTPDNTHKYGDNWNEEDLSIYSKDTPKNIDQDGGRGVKAFCRPYPIWTQGEPLQLSFDMKKSLFKYYFARKNTKASCAIFIPTIHYPNGIHVEINNGKYEYFREKNILLFETEEDVPFYGITIRPAN